MDASITSARTRLTVEPKFDRRHAPLAHEVIAARTETKEPTCPLSLVPRPRPLFLTLPPPLLDRPSIQRSIEIIIPIPVHVAVIISTSPTRTVPSSTRKASSAGSGGGIGETAPAGTGGHASGSGAGARWTSSCSCSRRGLSCGVVRVNVWGLILGVQGFAGFASFGVGTVAALAMGGTGTACSSAPAAGCATGRVIRMARAVEGVLFSFWSTGLVCLSERIVMR